jgi:hypothetical protein
LLDNGSPKTPTVHAVIDKLFEVAVSLRFALSYKRQFILADWPSKYKRLKLGGGQAYDRSNE